MRNRILILFSLMMALLILSACSSGSAAAPTPIGDPAIGKDIFNNGTNGSVPCATCHTLDGSELVGPSLQGSSERAGTRIEGVSAEDYLRQSITDPGAFLVPEYEDLMTKDFAEKLSEDDIDNLIAFLLTQ